MNTRSLKVLAGVLVTTLVVAGCSVADGQQLPTPTAPDSTPRVANPTPAPSQPARAPQPTARPEQPSVAPTPTATPRPAPVARLVAGTVARATADGVRVRILPGLDQPLIDQEDSETREITHGVTLEAGHPVVVQMGPVVVDGIAWYWVMDFDEDLVRWMNPGWVAADFLEAENYLQSHPRPVASINGVGHGAKGSGTLPAGFGLTQYIAAAPVDGSTECDLAAFVTGVDGTRVEVMRETVTESVLFEPDPHQSPIFLAASDGEAWIEVETDCSFAAMLIRVG
jgi:hypothetical protein